MDFLKGLFKVSVIIATLFVIGRIFFFQVARTENYSMVPNLLSGDVFLVYTAGTLGPGEVAICKDPENPGAMVVGRIMGVPGSTFELKSNTLYLNSNKIERDSVTSGIMYVDNTSNENAEFEIVTATEKVSGHVYNVALMDRAGDKNFSKWEVDSGFFIIGDNRNRARDSRIFGEIPIEDCVGTPFMIIWPADDSGDFKFKNRFLQWIY